MKDSCTLNRRQRAFALLTHGVRVEALRWAEPKMRKTWLLNMEDSLTECQHLMESIIDVTPDMKHGFQNKPKADFL
eukprot:3251048-Lingulodinium_polyedra.AAC.1